MRGCLVRVPSELQVGAVVFVVVAVVVGLVRVVDGCATLRYGDDNAGETKRRLEANQGDGRLLETDGVCGASKGGDTGTGTLWLMVESRRTIARWETDEEPQTRRRRSARHKSRAANKAEAGSIAGH